MLKQSGEVAKAFNQANYLFYSHDENRGGIGTGSKINENKDKDGKSKITPPVSSPSINRNQG